MSDTKAAQPYNASILTSLSFVQLLEVLLLLTACCCSFVYTQIDFALGRSVFMWQRAVRGAGGGFLHSCAAPAAVQFCLTGGGLRTFVTNEASNR
jgi:hypothetical protein